MNKFFALILALCLLTACAGAQVSPTIDPISTETP